MSSINRLHLGLQVAKCAEALSKILDEALQKDGKARGEVAMRFEFVAPAPQMGQGPAGANDG